MRSLALLEGASPQSRLVSRFVVVIRFEKDDNSNNPQPSGIVLKMFEAPPTLCKGRGMVNCTSTEGIRSCIRGEKRDGHYSIGQRVGYSQREINKRTRRCCTSRVGIMVHTSRGDDHDHLCRCQRDNVWSSLAACTLRLLAKSSKDS